MPVELRRVRLTDPEVAPLLAGLEAEYQERYGGNSELATTPAEQFDPPHGAFLVLVDDGTTVAGGGLRRHDADTCEVKRMWTSSAHRRAGHASTILGALEAEARRLGYRRLVLETGPAQPEALAFYRRLGYRIIPRYGPYPAATAFERDLSGESPPD